MGMMDEWNMLTAAEQRFIASHPTLANKIKEDSFKARDEARVRFPDEASRNNGPGDAFRHCYWAALLTRDIGVNNALAFTEAHENFPGNPLDEKAMDLYNNTQGISIGNGRKRATDVQLADLCAQALTDGKLKTLHP
jgi:hypothetical protein